MAVRAELPDDLDPAIADWLDRQGVAL